MLSLQLGCARKKCACMDPKRNTVIFICFELAESSRNHSVSQQYTNISCNSRSCVDGSKNRQHFPKHRWRHTDGKKLKVFKKTAVCENMLERQVYDSWNARKNHNIDTRWGYEDVDRNSSEFVKHNALHMLNSRRKHTVYGCLKARRFNHGNAYIK